jgi:hypothetical protein
MHHVPHLPPSPRYHGPVFDHMGSHMQNSDMPMSSLGKLPKLPFPVFDGDNPRLWIYRCESYFDMYEVEPEAWVKVASMYLAPHVACWFQSVERKQPRLSWPLLCRLLHERFGRDPYESLLRQLFRIHQQSSVTDYQDHFFTLVDQLAVYESVPDPLFFATRFVDGLRTDIRAVVMLQRPLDLDSACSLALLQEEVALPSGRHEHRKEAYQPWLKSATASARPMQLPPPPTSSLHKPESYQKKRDGVPSSVDGKLAALKAYRRARGLCDRCAEKWHRGHTCNATVQLHALQEVWELLSENSGEDSSIHEQTLEEPIIMAISAEAVTGSSAKRSMRFLGSMLGKDILILVDSGSTHSFINQSTVQHHTIVPVAATPFRVQVANGGLLSCDKMIPHAVWSIQGCEFSQDLRVLPLPKFDLILGMDWLEFYSPMEVHWQHRWLCIPYHDRQVVLYGCAAQATDILLHITPVMSFVLDTPPEAVHPAVSAILSQFHQVFAQPSSLPPVRACDHAIPLVPGATPVNIRPYRYSPSLKDEIEQHIVKMLQNGIIRPSSSEFSSPVLLVRKKDGSFRFCVDYRYLNALTIKWKFPIPVFD